MADPTLLVAFALGKVSGGLVPLTFLVSIIVAIVLAQMRKRRVTSR
jgi:hypothetical protein